MLHVAEAVPLGYALTSSVSEARCIRSLAIKGPVLEEQGLRAGHESVDIDILVDPACVGDLSVSLAELGWQERVPSTTAQIVSLHSVAVAHPRWPVEIDVHDRFPGFLADPQVVFDQLWRRRSSVSIAGQPIPCTDLVGSAAVTALHLLRDPERRAHELDDLVERLRTVLDADQRDDLLQLAEATGASETLAPVLDALGVAATGSSAAQTDLLAWHVRTRSSGAHSVAWVYELSRTPARQWPQRLWRALVLTEPEIRFLYPDEPEGWWGLTRGRVRRLAVGLRSLPSAVSLVLRTRSRP